MDVRNEIMSNETNIVSENHLLKEQKEKELSY